MSTKRDFDRTAQAWLAEGPSELADRVLDAALAEVHATNQRRRLAVLPWRSFTLNTPLRLAAGIAIVAVVGFAALSALGRGPGYGTKPTPTAITSPSTGPATPKPTIPLDLSMWSTYDSPRYGYSIKYPPAFAAVPATRDWVRQSRFEFWSSDGEGADRFIDIASPRDVQLHFVVMSALVPAGMTEVAWIDLFETPPAGTTQECLTTGLRTTPITIDGHPGHLSTECGNPLSAFVLVGDRMYAFMVDDSNVALFTTFVSTFRVVAAPTST